LKQQFHILPNGFEVLVHQSAVGLRVETFKYTPDSFGMQTTREASIALQVRRFRTLKELVEVCLLELPRG
jgi:hypothetical protein